MIIPTGKRKLQVNQGCSKHESIVDNDIFEKIAIGKLPGQDLADNQPKDPLGVGDAMSQGGLAPPPPDKDPNADLGLAGSNPRSIAPSGNPQKSQGHPADRFLGPAPVDTQQQVDPFETERQKIRQFVGFDNFGVDLKPGKAGDLEVTLIPPPGTPVDVGGLLQELQQHLGGQWGGESTPAKSTGGPIKFKYIPEGAGQTQKVTKDGPPMGAPGGSQGQVTQTV